MQNLSTDKLNAALLELHDIADNPTLQAEADEVILASATSTELDALTEANTVLIIESLQGSDSDAEAGFSLDLHSRMLITQGVLLGLILADRHGVRLG